MGEPDSLILSEFLKQYYERALYIPPEILVKIAPEEQEVIEEFLCQKQGRKVSVKVPQRGENLKIMLETGIIVDDFEDFKPDEYLMLEQCGAVIERLIYYVENRDFSATEFNNMMYPNSNGIYETEGYIYFSSYGLTRINKTMNQAEKMLPDNMMVMSPIVEGNTVYCHSNAGNNGNLTVLAKINLDMKEKTVIHDWCISMTFLRGSKLYKGYAFMTR